MLRDYSHPKHAGDYHEERVSLTIAADLERDALVLTFRSEDGSVDRFALRGNQLYEAKGAELTPVDGAGDLRTSTLARLDPLFSADSEVPSVATPVYHDLYGDLIELVTYEH